jgi:hypothetical protein
MSISKSSLSAATRTKPRARTDGLIVRRLDGEVLVYDRDRDRATCLNTFAADVWERCDGRTSPAALAHGVAKSPSDAVDERAIWLALDQLSRAHLLETGVSIPASVLNGTNRRELLRTLGLGVAIGVPMVTSILVPRVADAASCRPVGGPCAANADCCSFNCSSGLCQP